MIFAFARLALAASLLGPRLAVAERQGDEAAPTHLLFLAGGPSHGYGSHEYYAGAKLLARLLQENVPNVQTEVVRGWPKDASVFDGADAIVIGCDGGSLLNQNLAALGELMKKGVGLAVLHYGLTVPKGKNGDAMLDWIGGYYELNWSVNPTWEANFVEFPEHPVTRGVRPFRIRDEWYYHMRFREEMRGVTPLLTAVPPDSTRERPDGPHSNNPTVRSRRGMPEHVAWVAERSEGGRGFGFTGMHYHWNWAHDDFRKLVLNALVWIAGGEVPADGVSSTTPTLAELQEHLDSPKPANWNPEPVERMLEQFRRSGSGFVFRNNIVDGFSGNLPADTVTEYNLITYRGPVHRDSVDGEDKARALGKGAVLVEEDSGLFVDPAAGDYRLRPGSAAIDAGMDLGEAVPTDARGTARPSGAAYDLGAYEGSADD